MNNFIYSTYLKPYGYNELMGDIKLFKELFKDKIFVKSAGKTEQGRDIFLIRTGKGTKRLFCIGAVHAREYVSSAFLMRSIYELLSENSPALEKASFYICPMVNPDGVEIALGSSTVDFYEQDFTPELFKNNARNINLNANFPYYFSFVPAKRQGGIFAASEKETQSIINLCRRYDFSAALSFHCRGNVIFWQDRGNGSIKGDKALADILSKNCGFSLMPPTENVIDFSGGFENWFRHKFRKPALCVELVEDESLPFSQHCPQFDYAVNWEKTQFVLETFANCVF